MGSVFDRLVDQEHLIALLREAAGSAHHIVESDQAGAAVSDQGIAPRSSMTHAWLFTGPPGSGRSVAAQCFAAALQCQASSDEGFPGCGQCRACTTVMAGSHADVRRVVPEGLSISVKEMRQIVQIASRRPGVGRWQVVVVEDADRLTEGAANALLKVVEEPPERTVFLLCAPSTSPEDIAITLLSRCRHVGLVTPGPDAIARVLIERDGIDPDRAQWAASVCGGHVGRARRLATHDDAREQRDQGLDLARAATSSHTAYEAAEKLVATAEAAAKAIAAELDPKEVEELTTAMGAGGTGRGAASATRGSAGALKELERRQKNRATRISRDSLDRALVDLAALFRDALVHGFDAPVAAMHPDRSGQSRKMSEFATPVGLLNSIEAVLACREAIDTNVKPLYAVDAMVARIGQELRG